MPKYKLMYWNGRGYGEVARMIFGLQKDVDFEDYRFKDDEWPTIKGDKQQFPLGQAPVLLIDGVALPQSNAIYRHLAREFGYYGKNNMEAAKIDVICETVVDIRSKLIAIYHEQDEAKKAEKRKEFKETTTVPFFTFLQDRIKEAGGKFFVGNTLSLADFIVFSTLDSLYDSKAKIDGLLEQYPDLMKFYNGIKDESPLSSYLKSRPKTDF